MEAKPRRGNKPKEGTGPTPAATSARDTDSPVEQDPGVGRSVDRAPRSRRTEGTTRSTPNPGGSAAGRRATTGAERARAAMPARTPGRAPLERSSDAAEVEEPHGASRRSDRPEPTPELSARRAEVGRPQPGDRRIDAIRRTSRRRTGQPARGRTDGASNPSPIALVAGGGRVRDPGGRLGNEADGRHGSSRSDPPRPRQRPARAGRAGRSERSCRATARSSRRRTARGEQAAAMRHGCRRGGNLRRVERQRGHRTRPEELRLRRPTRRKPGEPRPGTGCNMPGAVNGGNRRGGEKPRGRSANRRSGIRRPKEGDLREWTFTGTSGAGTTARDEVPGEEGEASTARCGPTRLGSARTPKARPR